MKLYGGNPSPFFRKVRVVLEEKGLPYETESLVPIPKTPELLAVGNLTFAGVEVDARRWPQTARYYRALLSRPSFKTSMAQ